MQKLLNIIEQYVEWVALAIGGVFLLAMIVMYVIGTPVSAKVGSKDVNLADVDSVIYSSSGQLEEAMKGKTPLNVTVPSYEKRFATMLSGETVAPLKMSRSPWIGLGAPGSQLISVAGTEKTTTTNQAGDRIAVLPQLPAAEAYEVSQGKSYVNVNIAGAAVARGAAADVQGVDKLWITQGFTISAEEVQKAFADAKIPASFPTALLRVEVVRQEKLADGSWGNDTIIQPLPIHGVPAVPAAGQMDVQDAYLDWAMLPQNASALAVPSFYPWVAGDKWYAPGQENPNKVVVIRQPAVPPKAGPTRPTGPKAPRNRTGTSSGTNRRSGTGSGGGSVTRTRTYAPPNAGRPAGGGPGMMPSPGGPGMMPPFGGPNGMNPGFAGTPAVAGVGQTPAGATPEGAMVPPASFTMADVKSDLYVWVHDDTIEAGKTYQYQMRYMLLNPMYRQTRMVADPALAKTLMLVSEKSEWSDPITAPVVSDFFIASGVAPSFNGVSTVRLNVYCWQNGEWHMKMFVASPGDMIGLTDGGVNYQTGWTLVDVKNDPVRQEAREIVADPNGTLVSRSFHQDQTEEVEFQRQIGWQNPATAKPATPIPNGMPLSPGPRNPGGRVR